MHARVGAWLRRSGEAPPARIARHLEHAGQQDEAARAFLEAAKAAAEGHANRNALRFYGRALTLVAPDSGEAFCAHEERERIFRALGRHEEQVLELAALRSLADRTERPEFIAVAYARFARHELESDRLDGVPAYLQRAMSSAALAERYDIEVEVWIHHAALAQKRGDVEGALTANQQAIEASLRRQLQSEQGLALLQRADLLRSAERLEEARDFNADAIVIFRRLGLLREEADALLSMGLTLAKAGYLEDASTCFRASLDLDRRTGDRRELGRKLGQIGHVAAELGDLDEARAFLDRAERFFERLPDPASRLHALVARAEMELEEGAHADRVTELLDSARKLADEEDSGATWERMLRCRLHLTQDELHDAVLAGEAALRIAEGSHSPAREAHARALLAEARAKAGDDADARYHLGRLEEVLSVDGLERCERVLLSMARAYEVLGEPGASERAFGRADEVISRRLDTFRSPEVRARYFATPTVSSIRQRRL